MARPLALLRRNADFRRLFVAQLVVFGGDWFVVVPLLALLPELTGSGLWGGLVLAVDTGVIALVLPYAGTVADRMDRRTVLVVANVTAVLAVLLLFGVRDADTAWLAIPAVTALAAAKAFYMPAAQAALPNLVEPEDLSAANALAGSAWGTMLVVGASLGGLVAAGAGAYTSFLVAAVCLAVAAVLTLGVRRSFQASARTPAATRPATATALREALRYIRHRPRVLSLVTVKSAVGVGNGVLGVLPILVTVEYGLGAAGVGLVFAARGLGALVGPLLLRAVLLRPARLLPGLAVSMATYGVAYILAGLTPWFPVVVLLVTVAHLAGGGNWVMSNYALQVEVPDALRGRVFSTDMMIAMVAISASQGIAGALTDHVAPQLLLIACGAATLTYAVGWRLATLRLLRTAADPAGT